MGFDRNSINLFLITELEEDPSLHLVRIRFGTFSFDKITKGIKAKWIDKVSHFGGTAGLFNGFTIIALFELLAFILASALECLILLIQFCKSMTNKKKQLNIIEVEEFQSKEKENKNGDINKKLEDLAQKKEALLNEKDAILREFQKKITIHGIEEIINK